LTQAHTAAPQGYVFGATEGEHLLHFRDGGKICIKVGPAIGSDNLTFDASKKDFLHCRLPNARPRL